jgi:hypothetical protein
MGVLGCVFCHCLAQTLWSRTAPEPKAAAKRPREPDTPPPAALRRRFGDQPEHRPPGSCSVPAEPKALPTACTASRPSGSASSHASAAEPQSGSGKSPAVARFLQECIAGCQHAGQLMRQAQLAFEEQETKFRRLLRQLD